MSSLNLVPDPSLVFGQIGLFLANTYAIHRLWLSPYLKLQEARDNAGKNALSEAEALLKECVEKRAALRRDLFLAKENSRKEARAIAEAAENKAKALLQKAREEAAAEFLRLRGQKASEKKAEQDKLPVEINQLAKKMLGTLLAGLGTQKPHATDQAKPQAAEYTPGI